MTNTLTHSQEPVAESKDPTLRRKAQLSSFLGSAVEYYDFLLYAAAAGLVFPSLFFGNLSPAMGTTLSFIILLIGYISRPIGSMAFGHFGDKYGRKNVLIVTLLTMGIVSVCIGLLPSANHIGVAAPIILVVLRTVQGVAVGGEWAGATLMAMEHSKRESKGLGASFAIAGGPAGAVLSTLTLALFSNISGDSFADPSSYFVTDWGWRVPFLLSAGIVVFGLYLRSQVSESPEFEQARKQGNVQTGVPLMKMLKDSPTEIVLGSLAAMAGLFMQGLQGTFMVPYIVKSTAGTENPIDRADGLMMVTIGSIIAIFVMPAIAALSDVYGRRRVMITGGMVSIAGLWGVTSLIETGEPLLIWIGMILMVCVVQPAQYGPIGAFLSEKFDAAHRYTGSGMTFQLGSILGAGTAPLVANRLVSAESGLTPIVIYGSVLFVISSLAIYFSKETAHTETHAERFEETSVFKA
ncbi:MFS transporter [Corynebacterium hindlerae]|uniref:MFS transporter n=1 Tax=Corynebacterium hindlerae TaxID=699041 RepID=UPI001AD70C93|nr:MFS transporter [Corynebacterium hindlerae]QTH60607.1 MFS transporter [Corynebacterium hindlerae]